MMPFGRTRKFIAANVTHREAMGPPYYAALCRSHYQNVASFSESHSIRAQNFGTASWVVLLWLKLCNNTVVAAGQPVRPCCSRESICRA